MNIRELINEKKDAFFNANQDKMRTQIEIERAKNKVLKEKAELRKELTDLKDQNLELKTRQFTDRLGSFKKGLKVLQKNREATYDRIEENNERLFGKPRNVFSK